MNGYWIAAALLAGGIAAACALGLGPSKRQPLAELGAVDVPGRLDPYAAAEEDGFTVFPFDHTPGSIFLMGSLRPVSEVLALSVWRPSARAQALQALTRRVADRTQGIRWRTQGEYRIGEGTHEVNTSEHAARIVVREYPERQLAIGHMVWAGPAFSLQRQINLIESTAAAFEPHMPVAEYLNAARERPHD